MPIHRPTWYRLRSRENFGSFPCTNCETGKLKLIKDGIKVLTPEYFKIHQSENGFDPYDDNDRWSATMRCDETTCGEIVNLLGDTEMVETDEFYDEVGSLAIVEALRIQAVFPTPSLFKISKNVPIEISNQLSLAFRIYWTDVSACVSRVRTAVEALLDHQNVPKTKMTKNNKPLRMDLKSRIDAFANGAAHKDQLQGLRNIGNLGTHGGVDVSDDDLFDALDVIEFILTGIYDTQTINAKAQKLAGKKSDS